MKRQYFGTDGVRGEFGGPVINETFAARLGEAAGRWLHRDGAIAAPPLVLIGRDTRGSGPLLERALARGLAAAGVRVGTLGVVPTPAVSLAVREHKAALGVVVTASHNPAADNGIKFFGPSGTKLDDADELLIESLLPETPATADAAPAEFAAEASYVHRLSERLRPGLLRGWTIVVDAGNGAAHRTTPAVLRALGAEVDVIGGSPDGSNINAGCGSQHPQAMCRRVVETGARLGIAHDGDADRLIVSDEKGVEVDGDEVLAILAGEALRQGRLQHHTLVATVQSNLGLKRFMEQQRGRLVQTAVGDRYVIAAMLEGGFNLGGENSGHIICTDVSPCGDGLAAALLLIEAMIATGRPLSLLRTCLKKFPQATRALRVTRKPEVATLALLTSAIGAAEARLGADGRVLVRYSGTEPKIRLLVEGPEEALVADLIGSLERAVEQEGLRA